MASLTLVALFGVLQAARGPDRRLVAAAAFGEALARRDFRAIARTTVDPRTARAPSVARVARTFREQWLTATLTRLEVGKPRRRNGTVTLPVVAHTRVFGNLRGEVPLRFAGDRVSFGSELAFPGLRPGERLRRQELLPARAAILARDGTPLAQGPAWARSSPLGAAALPVTGTLAPPDDARLREQLYAAGFPSSWPVGRSGLEQAFERRLRGRPGGVLLAGSRVLARARPRPAPALRTTIDARLQRAAVVALGGRYGGIAVLDARDGAVRALAGIALSGAQPPGSTFKIVTAAAALEAGTAKPEDRFAVAREARIDGVPLANAHDEPCGGTLVEAFARSCNSVFAPLGVRIGARRLVATAERLGFNRPPPLPGAVTSVVPPASELRSPLELAATAIGQGRVLATALAMASVTQAVAADGERARPHVLPGAARGERALSAGTAAQLKRMMRAVVEFGTGVSAALPTVEIAGKTGTAELESRPQAAGVEQPVDDPSRTDAWFCGFAPYRRPLLALCVLLVRAGEGGRTAAPVARQVFATLAASNANERSR